MKTMCYLAMTAAEFAFCEVFPPKIAWMACHFSPYGTGLSNLPPPLPEESMLILNDRTPIHGHDPQVILEQLKGMSGPLLLDFQRPGCEETASLAKILAEGLDRPVGVSHLYAQPLSSPVFLPPVPPDVPLAEYLAPWQGREIWLELAPEGLCYSVTADGARAAALSRNDHPTEGIFDESLCCHYTIETQAHAARFSLWRTADDLKILLEKGSRLGVTQAVGLWQELGGKL